MNETIQILNNQTIEGYFRIEIWRDGVLVRELPRFRNVITHGGIKRFSNGVPVSLKMQFGSGNTPPTALDTGLSVPVGNKISVDNVGLQHNKTTPPFYSEDTFKCKFDMNTIVGNLAEIGTFMDGRGSGDYEYPEGLYSRTLLKDASGNPTIITVLPMEEVLVYYTLRQYENLDETIGTFKLNNEVYSYTSVACTEPEFVGRRASVVYGTVDSGFYPSCDAVLESDIPANVKQSEINSAAPYFTGSSYPMNSKYSEDGCTHAITLDYGKNITGDLPIKSIFIGTLSGNPRRIVFTPPIPKNINRKITIYYRNKGGVKP